VVHSRGTRGLPSVGLTGHAAARILADLTSDPPGPRFGGAFSCVRFGQLILSCRKRLQGACWARNGAFESIGIYPHTCITEGDLDAMQRRLSASLTHALGRLARDAG
jgi:hypothetical protein